MEKEKKETSKYMVLLETLKDELAKKRYGWTENFGWKRMFSHIGEGLGPGSGVSTKAGHLVFACS